MKTMLLGLDGATWKIIQDLIRKGYLPAFKGLLEKGVQAVLKSTIPPVTGAAWFAVATGLNPGKTGVIDFLKLDNELTLRPVNSSDYRGKAVWDLIGVEGYKVCVIDYPMLYPAYPVNGFMLSSWGRKLSAWPLNLLNEVKDIVESYDIFVNYHLEKYNDTDLFFEDLDRAVEKKLKVSLHLLKTKRWDFFVDVVSFTDWLQHRLWHYIDPQHPLHPQGDEARRIYERFAGYWQLLDDYLRQVMEMVDHLFIISDHGFGPQWGVFNLGKWLEAKGFLAQRRRSLKEGILTRLLHAVSKFRPLIDILPEKVYLKGQRKFTELSCPLPLIDLESSEAIVLGHTIPFGAVYVNPRFKNRVDDILTKIEKELRRISDDLGKDLRVTVFKLKDIYRGANSNKLPDLILTINDWSCVIVKDFRKDFIYLEGTYSPRHTGSHRIDGVFVAYGGDIRQGVKMNETSIFDVAPTILHLFGLPIPSTMDGGVLTEIFKPEGEFAKRKPKYVDPSYYKIKTLRERTKAKIKELRRSGNI